MNTTVTNIPMVIATSRSFDKHEQEATNGEIELSKHGNIIKDALQPDHEIVAAAALEDIANNGTNNNGLDGTGNDDNASITATDIESIVGTSPPGTGDILDSLSVDCGEMPLQLAASDEPNSKYNGNDSCKTLMTTSSCGPNANINAMAAKAVTDAAVIATAAEDANAKGETEANFDPCVLTTAPAPTLTSRAIASVPNAVDAPAPPPDYIQSLTKHIQFFNYSDHVQDFQQHSHHLGGAAAAAVAIAPVRHPHYHGSDIGSSIHHSSMPSHFHPGISSQHQYQHQPQFNFQFHPSGNAILTNATSPSGFYSGTAHMGLTGIEMSSEATLGNLPSPPPLGVDDVHDIAPPPLGAPFGAGPGPYVVYHPAETLAQYHGMEQAANTSSVANPPTKHGSKATGKRKKSTANGEKCNRKAQKRFSVNGIVDEKNNAFDSTKAGKKVPLTTNIPREVERIDPRTRARIATYCSCSEAARRCNINRTKMSRTCRAGGGLIGGLYFRYIEKTCDEQENDSMEVPDAEIQDFQGAEGEQAEADEAVTNASVAAAAMLDLTSAV